MNGIIIGNFNPITLSDIEKVKKERKKHKLDVVYFMLKDDGQQNLVDLKKILAISISPYKKFKIIDTLPKEELYSISEDSLTQSLVRKGDFKYISKPVRSYIMKKGLYCNSIIASMLKENRFNHSISVANTCVEIAKYHNIDLHKAYIAGIYHDIAKNLSIQDSQFYINIEKPYELTYPAAVWHQYIGYYLLKRYYCLTDKSILKAIRHHCLGDDRSDLSKLLFVCDKIEPTRKYDTTSLIKLAKKDLNKAYDVVKKQHQDFVKKGN